ncbi:hypothetical protein KIN_11960 [Litoreibacter roseus]|uniref:Uncharacterized protein n=1 Tax=Litoreibacter roseus TaxID=2601869 RepID=A0A6N6JFY9_9RHOB|nr:hypothetical protein KIN_11960 [Litoreibacter roseus]
MFAVLFVVVLATAGLTLLIASQIGPLTGPEGMLVLSGLMIAALIVRWMAQSSRK